MFEEIRSDWEFELVVVFVFVFGAAVFSAACVLVFVAKLGFVSAVVLLAMAVSVVAVSVVE